MSTITRYNRSLDPGQSGRPLDPLVFAMRIEFRRSAVYVLLGIVLILAIRSTFSDFFPPTRGGAWGALIPFAAFMLIPLAAFRWRLRVDSSGISRRRIWGWDLWSWDRFEQGRVLESEGESTSYVLPDKPFWARKLTLGLLEDSDRAQVASIIERLWMRPVLELPAELALRYGFRKEALIAPGTLLLRAGAGGEEMRYSWKEVQSLRIRRHDRRRRDFEELEIVLPDRVVSFSLKHNQGQIVRSWSGMGGVAAPGAQVLAGVLEKYVPSARVHVTSLDEAPQSVDEWQDHHTILARRGRELTVFRRVVWGASILFLGFVLFEFRRDALSGFKFLAMLGVMWGVLLMLLRTLERDHRQAVATLESNAPCDQ